MKIDQNSEEFKMFTNVLKEVALSVLAGVLMSLVMQLKDNSKAIDGQVEQNLNS